MQAICSRLVAGILALPVVCSAQAADLGSPPPAAAYVTPVQPLSIVSEVRIGGAVQDPGSAEKNTNAINGEILFSKPVVSLDPFWQAFVPRPTVGGSYNFDGRTSFAYIGATWTVDLFPQTLNNRVFLEGFFGAGAHNGYTGLKANAPAGLQRPGLQPSLPRSGGARLSSDRALEHHGHRRAHVECRPVPRESRPDEFRRQDRLHVLSPTPGSEIG